MRTIEEIRQLLLELSACTGVSGDEGGIAKKDRGTAQAGGRLPGATPAGECDCRAECRRPPKS